MKTAGMFTAAQARSLSDEEYAHYLELGCVEVDTARTARMLREVSNDAANLVEEARHENSMLEEELEAAREEAKELDGQLQTLRGSWRRVMGAVREFAQELLGNDIAIKLAAEEKPGVRP